MVTNLELNIKHSRACECVCFGGMGVGDGGWGRGTAVTASCVDVCVVFNVKCTLFFG